jgi:hypothetical protein
MVGQQSYFGWPDMSYGTFGGEIVAIENFISENGKYRVLIAPDNEDKWPKQLSIGSGTNDCFVEQRSCLV